MENQYMQAQCKNMMAMIAAFTQACELAAKEDDGVLSRSEAQELKKIRTAAARFQGELTRVVG